MFGSSLPFNTRLLRPTIPVVAKEGRGARFLRWSILGDEMLKRIREASPSFKARVAGGLFLLVILTAAFTQFFIRGRLGFAADLSAGLIEVSGMIAVTLLFYDIFKAVNRSLSWLAASFNFLALTLELLQLIPRGVFIGIGFHAFHCFLIGYLIFTSTFLPRILGGLMVLAGLCWLAFLSPTLTNYLSPYNLALGMLGEASVSLWLLAMGVNVQRWKQQASA
jgi:Domain of unknown function (DUF4386)